MKISEPVLFDSNVLIYTQDQDFPFYKISAKLVKMVVEGQLEGVLTYQNLLEFYSVVTNKKRVASPIIPELAFSMIENYLNSPFRIIYPNIKTASVFSELSQKSPVKGGVIFDVYLAATMRSNNISTIVTANIADFEGFLNLQIIDLKSL